MLETELIQEFETRFSEFASTVGGTIQSIRKQPVPSEPDLVIQAEIRNKPITLIVEAKSQGEPRYIREAGDRLRGYLSQFPGAYPIVIAPYISSQSANLLKSKQVGYFDLAGNVLIDIGPLFISVTGKPNSNPVQKKLKSLFAAKSSRVLRVLLTNPAKTWYVQDLAAEAGVSIGLASKLKQRLLELELVDDVRAGIILRKPGDLLDEWAKAYSYQQNDIFKYYSPNATTQVERQVSEFARNRGLGYALTMFSGAERISPFVRYNFSAFYFSGSMLELEQQLELKSTDSGANVWAFRPFDEGVYYGMQNVGGIQIASNVQLYLDLINYKGRGEEQARALRERLLKY
jgi:hypothetical protein